MSTIVYLITGSYTPLVYIGYCDGHLDPKEAFKTQASRTDHVRGDTVWLAANNGDIDGAVATIIGEFETEEEAFLIRNDERTRDHRSITDATLFPLHVSDRISDKTLVNTQLSRNGWKKCSTAREAYSLGAYKKEDIFGLREFFPRDEIASDLDRLTPKDFNEKYSVRFSG